MKILSPIFFTYFLFTTPAWSQTAPVKASDFSGEYSVKKDHYLTSEDRVVKNVENILKINAISDTEAQILVENYTKNLHSCQLVGKAKLEKNILVFKSQVSPQLNRGKKAQCVLKISKSKSPDGATVIKLDDIGGMCRLQFCGFQAELTGEFRSKPPVEVQDKN